MRTFSGVKDEAETKCPLCGAPRPRGATRCRCNYMFEYDRAGGGSVALPAGGRIGLVAVAIAAAVGTAMLFTSSVSRGENSRPEVGWFLIPAGLFAVCGAWFDWSWFLRVGKARLVTAILGRTGARVFYALLGGAVAGIGAGMLLL